MSSIAMMALAASIRVPPTAVSFESSSQRSYGHLLLYLEFVGNVWQGDGKFVDFLGF